MYSYYTSILTSLKWMTYIIWRQGRIQTVSLGGAISVIFGSQVSVGSQVSFRIVKNHGENSYFRRFQGERSPQSPPWIRPCLEIGKIMHKINSGNPPANFSNSLLPWIKFIPMQPVVLYEESFSGKQHQINTKKIFKTSWPQNLGLYWSLLLWAFFIYIQKTL